MVGMDRSDPLRRVVRTGSRESELNGYCEVLGDPLDQDDAFSTHVDFQKEDSTSRQWTDEKHSLYLKSMEVSFVNELYNSFGLLGCRSQKDLPSDANCSKQIHSSPYVSTEQFKVFKDGSWTKINHEKRGMKSNREGSCGGLLANPWMRHFKSGCRCQTASSCTHQKKAVLATTVSNFPDSASPLCFQGSDSSNTEVTDQNFTNEDVKCPSKVCRKKRMRTSAISTSSKDQVVP